MSDQTSAKLNDDPVCRRIARILEAKRRQNEEVLGTLKAVDDAWEGLTKEVDATIGTEFDLIEAEREAVGEAKKRLEKPRTLPFDEGFVLGGKIRDDDRKSGLPGVRVRVVREKEGREEVLAETVTDRMGNFAGLVPREKLRATDAARGGETLRIEALTREGERPLFTTRKKVVLEEGKTEELELELRSGRKIADNLAAAETVRDSVDESLRVVERRIASMRTAHTAVNRFAELTRDGLKELREDLAVDAPEIVAAVSVAGIVPPPPGDEGAPPPAPPSPPAPAPPTTSTPLEHVRGIGPKRGERLRAAGIRDLEAFLRTDTAALIEIMGFDAHVAKEDAERILRDHESARKRPSKKAAATRRAKKKTLRARKTKAKKASATGRRRKKRSGRKRGGS